VGTGARRYYFRMDWGEWNQLTQQIQTEFIFLN
jgi:hypothetical protein